MSISTKLVSFPNITANEISLLRKGRTIWFWKMRQRDCLTRLLVEGGEKRKERKDIPSFLNYFFE